MTDADRVAYLASIARSRLGSGALITDRGGRVLMVEPTYKDYFEIPGGVVEADESAPNACARECLEELGIHVPIGRLLVVDHQNDGGIRGDSIMFVYDGGVIDDPSELRLPADELAGFAFIDAGELESVTTERLARRLRAALRARANSTMIEIVGGVER